MQQHMPQLVLQPLQHQQQQPLQQGKGHEHIPVLQLGQSLSPAGGVLVLDRLDIPQPAATPPPLGPTPQQQQQPLLMRGALANSNAPAGMFGLPPPVVPPAPGSTGGSSQLNAQAVTIGAAPPLPLGSVQQQQQHTAGPILVPMGQSHPSVPTAPQQQQQQPLVVLGPGGSQAPAAAGPVGGAPSGVMMPPVSHLLQSAVGNLQVCVCHVKSYVLAPVLLHARSVVWVQAPIAWLCCLLVLLHARSVVWVKASIAWLCCLSEGNSQHVIAVCVHTCCVRPCCKQVTTPCKAFW
jgi:hypothetical protein